jgi:hypothetical protein
MSQKYGKGHSLSHFLRIQPQKHKSKQKLKSAILEFGTLKFKFLHLKPKNSDSPHFENLYAPKTGSKHHILSLTLDLHLNFASGNFHSGNCLARTKVASEKRSSAFCSQEVGEGTCILGVCPQGGRRGATPPQSSRH